MLRWVLVVIATTGCRQVLGLDDPEPVPQRVHVRYGFQVVDEQASGTLVTDVLPPASQLPITVVLDSGARVTPVRGPDNSFEFDRERPDQTYAIVDGPYTRFGDTETFTFEPQKFGHYDRAPVTGSQPIEAMIPNAGSGAATFYSTGLRAAVDATAMGTTYTADWHNADGADGAALLDGSRGDQLWWLQYQDDGTGALRAVSSASAQVAMSPGVATSFSANATAIAQDRCASVDLRFADELARITPYAIGTAQAPFTAWGIASTPAAPNESFAYLAYGGSNTMIGNQMLRTMFGDPFPHEDLVGVFQVGVSGNILLPGSQGGTSIATSILTVVSLSGSCTETVSSGGQVGIVRGVRIAGQPVGPTVTVDPASPLEVDLDVTDAPPTDAFDVVLYEATVDASRTTRLTAVAQYTTAHPHLSIPPAALKSGHYYGFEVIAERRWPDAAHGDFRTLAFPYAWAVTFTPPFLVDQP